MSGHLIDFDRERRIDQLDQIRGVAVLSVILLHWRTPFFPGGMIGVGIFFCLSGFLITTFLLQPAVFGQKIVVQFIVRRLLRIYPAYVIAVAANMIFLWLFRPSLFELAKPSMVQTFFFLGLPDVHTMGFGVMWTLLVEVWFYLTIPLAMLLLGRIRGALTYCAILIVLGFLGLTCPGFLMPLTMWGAVIAIGSLTALAVRTEWFRRRDIPKGWLTIGAGLIILVLVFTPSPTGRAIFWKDILGSIVTAFAIIDLLKHRNLWVSQWLARLGRISYSVYLFHALLLDVLTMLPHQPFKGAWTVLYFGATLGISYLSWLMIEKPGISAGRVLSKALV